MPEVGTARLRGKDDGRGDPSSSPAYRVRFTATHLFQETHEPTEGRKRRRRPEITNQVDRALATLTTATKREYRAETTTESSRYHVLHSKNMNLEPLSRRHSIVCSLPNGEVPGQGYDDPFVLGMVKPINHGPLDPTRFEQQGFPGEVKRWPLHWSYLASIGFD